MVLFVRGGVRNMLMGVYILCLLGTFVYRLNKETYLGISILVCVFIALTFGPDCVIFFELPISKKIY